MRTGVRAERGRGARAGRGAACWWCARVQGVRRDAIRTVTSGLPGENFMITKDY